MFESMVAYKVESHGFDLNRMKYCISCFLSAPKIDSGVRTAHL